MVGACSGSSGAPPVVPFFPGRCHRTVPPQYGTRGRTPGPRGPYCSIPSQRGYLLGIVEARLHGEGLWAFSRGVNVVEAGGCCKYSTVHGKHRAVVCRGCLRFLFRPSLATVHHGDIYGDIPTWVPRVPMLHFDGCRGVHYYGWGG